MVHGRVQGVGFRIFVEREARALGLTGWVRNREDGQSVEVLAEGDQDSLRRFEARLREGPAFALVSGVDASWSEESENPEAFSIR